MRPTPQQRYQLDILKGGNIQGSVPRSPQESLGATPASTIGLLPCVFFSLAFAARSPQNNWSLALFLLCWEIRPQEKQGQAKPKPAKTKAKPKPKPKPQPRPQPQPRQCPKKPPRVMDTSAATCVSIIGLWLCLCSALLCIGLLCYYSQRPFMDTHVAPCSP